MRPIGYFQAYILVAILFSLLLLLLEIATGPVIPYIVHK